MSWHESAMKTIFNASAKEAQMTDIFEILCSWNFWVLWAFLISLQTLFCITWRHINND